MRLTTFLWPALVVSIVAVGVGCGGTSKVSSSSLDSRLLPSSALPGFSVERRLDWSDPVNLTGEGLDLPQITHPSDAVKEFSGKHLEGAAGEVLKKGAGLNATEVRVGVAKFKSAADAVAVRKWMHSEDLQQPCFSECAFTTRPVALSGAPGLDFVVQSAPAPPRPPGVPKPPAGQHAPVGVGPANYLAEFSVGPYLYWVWLPGSDAGTKTQSQVEFGLRAFYTHAKRAGA